jgi:hypothetical protein
LACYIHGMDNCQDTRYSRGPLAIGRPRVRAENIFDGTKLALVVEPSHNHNRWYKVTFSPAFDQFESLPEQSDLRPRYQDDAAD